MFCSISNPSFLIILLYSWILMFCRWYLSSYSYTVQRDHSFSTLTKPLEKKNISYPWYAHVHVSFLENFVNALNKWSQITFSRLWTLREKCPNKEFYLVRIFLYSDWIRRFTTEKHGQEKTPYLEMNLIRFIFTQWV